MKNSKISNILFLFFLIFKKKWKEISIFVWKNIFFSFFSNFWLHASKLPVLPQKWLKNILQRWQKVAKLKMWPAGSLCVWGGVLVRKTIFRREGWGRAICICIKKLGGLICYQGHTKRYPLPPNAFGTFPYNYKLNQI